MSVVVKQKRNGPVSHGHLPDKKIVATPPPAPEKSATRIQQPKSEPLDLEPAEIEALGDVLPNVAGRVLSTVTPSGIAAIDPDVSPPKRVPSHLGRRKPEAWINEQNPRARLVIDPQFRDACRRLTEDERAKLKTDIARNGCLQPLMAWWDGQRLLAIDGHHRWEICSELDTWIDILALPFADRAEVLQWITEHQLGRRNLTPAERDELLARDYAALASPRGGRKAKAHDAPLKTAAKVVAEKHGVDPATVKRAVAADKAKQKISQATGRPKAELADLAREEATALASLPAEEIKQAFAGGRNAVRTAARQAAASKKDLTQRREGAKKARGASDLTAELRATVRRLVLTLDDHDQRPAAQVIRNEAQALIDEIDAPAKRRKSKRRPR
jgi:hypothetical protein